MRRGSDRAALSEILPRAASPLERAGGVWLEPASSARVDERLEAWARSLDCESVDGLLRLLAARGLEGHVLTASLSDARLATSSGTAALPAWATVLGTLLARARGECPDPLRVTAREIVGADEWPEGTLPSAPWRFEAVCQPWLAVATAALDLELEESSIDATAPARVGLLGALARRWHEILVRPLLAAPTLADTIRSVPSREAATVEAAYLGAAPTIDDWLRFFIAYPVSARLMALSFGFWQANLRKLLHRLSRDRDEIARSFGAETRNLGALAKCCWAGDPHDGHRQVALLRFESGLELVYKPRSLAPDLWYAAAYRELTGDSYEPCGRIVTRRDYGWQGIVRPAPCETLRAVRAYFRRIGSHARVLELIAAIDMHGENVIAAGEFPTLIDVETLLTPRIPLVLSSQAMSDLDDASPLATGLITVKARGLPGRTAHELGALATPGWVTESPDTPSPDAATGAVSGEAGRFYIATALPRHDGRHVSPEAYEDEIIAGYLAADRSLRVRSGHWLASAEVTAARLRPRFVYRETRLYARLMMVSLSPSALRDGVARELVLETLWRSSSRAGTATPAALVQAEIDAVRVLDIPLFRIAPSSPAVLAPRGRASRWLERAPLGQLERRVGRLDRVQPAAASDGIRTALFVRNPSARRPNGLGAQGAEAIDTGMLSRRLLDLSVGDDPARPAWFGLRYEGAFACWSLGSLSADLMTGTAGLAAVIADVALYTEEPEYRVAAAGLVTAAPDSLGQLQLHERGAGVLPLASSVAGAMYGFHRAASTLRLETDEIEAFALEHATPAAHADLASETAWLLALSGCQLASSALRDLRLQLAYRTRDRLGQLEHGGNHQARGCHAEARFTDVPVLARALIALQRLAPGHESLETPARLLIEVFSSPFALDSFATHALLATACVPERVRLALKRVVAEHRPDAAAPALERAEHSVAKSGRRGRTMAATLLACRHAEAGAPERFNLGAIGGLAGACHLALRLQAPLRFAPLRVWRSA